jgi:CRISPR-associated protein Csx14
VAEASIPVDLFNPGQVFACLGFVEATLQLGLPAEGIFDWSDPVNTRFWLRAPGDESPVARVLSFLAEAEAVAEAPAGAACVAGWKQAWGPPPLSTDREYGYPFPEPPSPATLVCLLRRGSDQVRIDHWGDGTDRDSVKFWGGAGGYPGSALARDALAALRDRALGAASDPFALSAPQSSSFRLDWRRDYIPIDAGFSLNDHASMATVGFPVVEVLGAIGLTHARPRRIQRRDKLDYAYAVVGRNRPANDFWASPPVLRAALGTTPFPLPTRRFRMRLGWPGQENQARSITTVDEETP